MVANEEASLEDKNVSSSSFNCVGIAYHYFPTIDFAIIVKNWVSAVNSYRNAIPVN